MFRWYHLLFLLFFCFFLIFTHDSWASLAEKLEHEVFFSAEIPGSDTFEKLVCESSLPSGKWEEGKCLIRYSSVDFTTSLDSKNLCTYLGCFKIKNKCLCDSSLFKPEFDLSASFKASLYDVRFDFWETPDDELILAMHGAFYPQGKPKISYLDDEYKPGWFLSLYRVPEEYPVPLPFRGFSFPSFYKDYGYRGRTIKDIVFTIKGNLTDGFKVDKGLFWLNANMSSIHMFPLTYIRFTGYEDWSGGGHWFTDIPFGGKEIRRTKVRVSYEASFYYSRGLTWYVRRRIYQEASRKNYDFLNYGLVFKKIDTKYLVNGRGKTSTNFCFNGICSRFFRNLDLYRIFPLGYKKAFIYARWNDGDRVSGILFNDGTWKYYKSYNKTIPRNEEVIFLGNTPLYLMKQSIRLPDGSLVLVENGRSGGVILEKIKCAASHICHFKKITVRSFLDDKKNLLLVKASHIHDNKLYVAFYDAKNKKVYVDIWDEKVIGRLLDVLPGLEGTKNFSPQIAFKPSTGEGFPQSFHPRLYSHTSRTWASNPKEIEVLKNIVPNVGYGILSSLYIGNVTKGTCEENHLDHSLFVCELDERIQERDYKKCRLNCFIAEKKKCRVESYQKGKIGNLICPFYGVTFYYRKRGTLMMPLVNGRLAVFSKYNDAKTYQTFLKGLHGGYWWQMDRCEKLRIYTGPGSWNGELYDFMCHEGLVNSGIKKAPMEIEVLHIKELYQCLYRYRYFVCSLTKERFYNKNECEASCYSADSLVKIK